MPPGVDKPRHVNLSSIIGRVYYIPSTQELAMRQRERPMDIMGLHDSARSYVVPNRFFNAGWAGMHETKHEARSHRLDRSYQGHHSQIIGMNCTINFKRVHM